VTIPLGDVNLLVQQQRKLALTKGNIVNPPNLPLPDIQWLTSDVSTEIKVGWEEIYHVFFTNTQIAPGSNTVIQPQHLYRAGLGNEYGYGNGSWSRTGTAPRDSIGIKNISPPTASFGISGQYSDAANPAATAPFVLTELTGSGGLAYLTPALWGQRVTLSFSQVWGPGIEKSPDGPSITVWAYSNSPVRLHYEGGKWTRPNNQQLVKDLVDFHWPWSGTFFFILAADIFAPQFAKWIEKKVPDLRAWTHDGETTDPKIVFQSSKDRTKEILALQDQWYDEPLVHWSPHPGVEDIFGRRVLIRWVEQSVSPLDSLPLGAAAHS